MSCFTSLAILMSSSPSVLYPGLGTMAPVDILVPGTALDKILANWSAENGRNFISFR